MSEAASMGDGFIGYEYRDITVMNDMVSIYLDGYENFGWRFESSSSTPAAGINKITMKFKRDRKIRNKVELTRLQRQFDSCINEITSMEKSKSSSASIAAFIIGLIGTAFIAGATFSYLGGLIALCVVLAIPGFICWIIPYPAYNYIYAKKCGKVTPLIESKFDEAYEVCEKANNLL